MSSPSGMFLENILHTDLTLKHSDDVTVISDSGLDGPADIDNRAVDLVLGRYPCLNLYPDADVRCCIFT